MVWFERAQSRPVWLEKSTGEAGRAKAREKSWDLKRENLEQRAKEFSSRLLLEVLNKGNGTTRTGLPAAFSCPAHLGLPGLVNSGGFLLIVLFVCGLVCRFSVVEFVFLAFSLFLTVFSQHMVLIMCWKSRQAAGQTAMSPTESSKSSTTSKVSTTPWVLPSSFHLAWGGPSVGLPQIPFVFWWLIVSPIWKGNLFLAC